MLWLTISFTVINAREKNIKQQKTIYAILRNNKARVGLFFFFIYFILDSITNKFAPIETMISPTGAEPELKKELNKDGATRLTTEPNAQPAPAPVKAPLSGPSVNRVPTAVIPAFTYIPRLGGRPPVTAAEALPR